MLMLRHGWRLIGELFVWARRSGRLWLPVLLPVILITALLVASSKVAVTTAVYTLF